MIVCVAAWEEDSYVEALASYAEALNSDRVCVIRPYEQMSAFMQDDVLMQEFNGIKLPNVMGNRLVLPLFEKMIGDTYLNYHGQGVKFMVGETVVDAHGTSMKDVEMIAPQPTDAVSAENMFGYNVGDEIPQRVIGTLGQQFCRITFIVDSEEKALEAANYFQSVLKVYDENGNRMDNLPFDTSRAVN